jgi:hypothetical protein
MTSSRTQSKAKAVLESWGEGIENLLLISDENNKDLGSISFDTVRGVPKSGMSVYPDDPSQQAQIWGMKYINSNDNYKHLRHKKWFFIADDDSWVNIPALLDLISRYDSRCPVVFGYVWSKIWIEDLDYHSGGAGLLMTGDAFRILSEAFYTSECPFRQYHDITFGRCAWTKKVQIVHHRGFFYDPPERSKDRHEMIWLPEIGEAISYHYVTAREMRMMTQYVNQRWQYRPLNTQHNNGTFLAITPSLIASIPGFEAWKDNK